MNLDFMGMGGKPQQNNTPPLLKKSLKLMILPFFLV